MKHSRRMSLLLFFLFLGTSIPFESAWAGKSLPAGRHGFAFDHSAYAKILQGYAVNGEVDYLKLKRERQNLDAYVESLESLSRENDEEMNRDEKIAFWINAYNVVGIKLVIDHYPL